MQLLPLQLRFEIRTYIYKYIYTHTCVCTKTLCAVSWLDCSTETCLFPETKSKTPSSEKKEPGTDHEKNTMQLQSWCKKLVGESHHLTKGCRKIINLNVHAYLGLMTLTSKMALFERTVWVYLCCFHWQKGKWWQWTCPRLIKTSSSVHLLKAGNV